MTVVTISISRGRSSLGEVVIAVVDGGSGCVGCRMSSRALVCREGLGAEGTRMWDSYVADWRGRCCVRHLDKCGCGRDASCLERRVGI